MARKREFDEVAVLRAARDLFWRRGYVAASIADLEQATGINRSSLYSAFGTKRQLFTRATALYLDEITNPPLKPLDAPGAGQQELAAYFLALADIIEATADCNETPGCLILNSANELYALDEEAAVVVRRHRASHRSAFLNALTFLDDGVIDLDAKAELLTVVQIGILMTSRSDAAAAARLARLQAREIENW